MDAAAAAAARGRPPARPGAAAAGRSVELSRVAAKLWIILTFPKWYDDGTRTRDESYCTGVTQKFNIFGTHNQHPVLGGDWFTRGLE